MSGGQDARLGRGIERVERGNGLRIGGILFDKDGTLFEYHATWRGVFQDLAWELCGGDAQRAYRLLEAGGYDVARDCFRSNSVLAAGDTRDLALLWASLLGCEAEALRRRMEAVFDEVPVARAVAAADLDSLLRGLRARHLALGVATHDSRAAAENVLRRFGVLDCFAFICGYDCGCAPKPDAAMALAFCRAVGLVPQEIVVVGDNPHDMHMGRAAGAAAVVGVLTGSSSRAELSDCADVVLASIADLPAWLD